MSDLKPKQPSKFLKMLEDVTPATTSTQPNPALAQAQKKVNDDTVALKKKQKEQAQTDINTTNNQLNQLKTQANSTDPAQKAAALAGIAAANSKLQQAQTILKQP